MEATTAAAPPLSPITLTTDAIIDIDMALEAALQAEYERWTADPTRGHYTLDLRINACRAFAAATGTPSPAADIAAAVVAVQDALAAA